MTIREMHYNFYTKLNMLPTQNDKKFYPRELDHFLNEAQLMYVRKIISLNPSMIIGHEFNQKGMDELRTLVRQEVGTLAADPKKMDRQGNEIDVYTDNSVGLPNDYLHLVKGYLEIGETPEAAVRSRIKLTQFKDRVNQNILLALADTIYTYILNDNLFVYIELPDKIQKHDITYIKYPATMVNIDLSTLPSGVYKDINGITRTESVNCELPEQVHYEIVDMAAALVSGNLQSQNYQAKLDQLQRNQGGQN